MLGNRTKLFEIGCNLYWTNVTKLIKNYWLSQLVANFIVGKIIGWS